MTPPLLFSSSSPRRQDRDAPHPIDGRQAVRAQVRGLGLQPPGQDRVVPGQRRRPQAHSGKRATIKCSCKNRRSFFLSIWCLNSQDFNRTQLDGGNITVSWIKYTPLPSHHHQTLTCRGANEEMMTAASQIVEDYHRLEIFCELEFLLTLFRKEATLKRADFALKLLVFITTKKWE